MTTLTLPKAERKRLLIYCCVPDGESTVIASSLAGNNGSNALTGLVQPVGAAVNLTVFMHTGWSGGDVTINGTDQFDQAVTEVFTSGSNVSRIGVKIFKTITSGSKATVGGTAAVADFAQGNKFGFVGKMNLTDAVGAFLFWCNRGTSDLNVLDSAPVFDSTYNGVTPADSSTDGTGSYLVHVNVDFP